MSWAKIVNALRPESQNTISPCITASYQYRLYSLWYKRTKFVLCTARMWFFLLLLKILHTRWRQVVGRILRRMTLYLLCKSIKTCVLFKIQRYAVTTTQSALYRGFITKQYTYRIDHFIERREANRFFWNTKIIFGRKVKFFDILGWLFVKDYCDPCTVVYHYYI